MKDFGFRPESGDRYGRLPARSVSRRVLLSPWFLMALALLILNDHLLKALYPSFVTGKLSDFAGLFIFPLFITVVLSRWSASPRQVLLMHGLVGVAFAAWKLAPVEIVLEWLARLTSLPMPSRVKDATDLIALSMLPLSYLFWRRRNAESAPPQDLSIATRLAAGLVVIAAGAAIMATSESTSPELYCCEGIRGNVDGDENDEIDISDFVYLVDYVFNDGPRPPCVEEADIDASGDKNPITEADYIYLRNYFFENGPPPPECGF